MGMSTHILFLRERDQEFLEKKAVLEACWKAEVSIPEEIQEYFQDNYADPESALEIEVQDTDQYRFSANASDGYCIDVQDLPPGTRYIRFYNSW